MVTETLNLDKGEKLNISKTAPSLTKAVFAAGWDKAPQGAPQRDVDIFALLLNSANKRVGPELKNSVVYFNNPDLKGLFLDKDNRDGEGDGDDEKITIDFNAIPAEVAAINMYINVFSPADLTFSKIENAYVRCFDSMDIAAENDTTKGLFVFNLSDNGGRNNACLAGRFERNTSGNWIFQAKEDYMTGDIQEICNPFVG